LSKAVLLEMGGAVFILTVRDPENKRLSLHFSMIDKSKKALFMKDLMHYILLENHIRFNAELELATKHNPFFCETYGPDMTFYYRLIPPGFELDYNTRVNISLIQKLDVACFVFENPKNIPQDWTAIEKSYSSIGINLDSIMLVLASPEDEYLLSHRISGSVVSNQHVFTPLNYHEFKNCMKLSLMNFALMREKKTGFVTDFEEQIIATYLNEFTQKHLQVAELKRHKRWNTNASIASTASSITSLVRKMSQSLGKRPERSGTIVSVATGVSIKDSPNRMRAFKPPHRVLINGFKSLPFAIPRLIIKLQAVTFLDPFSSSTPDSKCTACLLLILSMI
jgi:hypothetical protein